MPVLALLAAVLVGWLPGSAHADSTDPSITCSLSITVDGQPVTSVVSGTPVTLTATITDPYITPKAQPDISFWNDGANEITNGQPVTPTISGTTITASLTTASIAEGGPWDITAQYAFGDNLCISDPQELTVTTPGLLTTTTTVGISQLGNSNRYSIKATVTRQISGPNTFPSLSGTVYFYSDGTQDPDYPNGVALGKDGTATITWGGFPPGPHTIMASYSGDVFDNGGGDAGSSGSATLSVEDQPQLTYSGPASAASGTRTTLSATLVDSDGNPLAGKPVTLTIRGSADTCTGTTDAKGVASCAVIVHEAPQPQTYTVDASFASDGLYLAATGSGALTVVPGSTTLTYTGDTTAANGHAVSLRATLVDGAGEPVPNATVTFTLPLEQCSATTDASGVAQCQVTIGEAPGSAPTVAASFAGDTSYLGSAATSTLTILRVASLAYAGDTTAVGGGTATIAFVLTDAATGAPLAGEPVTVTFAGTQYPLTTDASGRVAQTVTAPLAAGEDSVTAAFGGDASHAPVTGTGTLTVTSIPTTLSYTGDTTAPGGGTATIAFRLIDTTSGAPLAGEPVAVTFGGTTYALTTDADGRVAQTVAVPLTVGKLAVSASFGGDGAYRAATGTGTLTVTSVPTTLVYTGDTTVVSGGLATLSAQLTTATGPVRDGEPVTLSLATGEQCRATTVAGAASCTVRVFETPSAGDAVTATFAGDGAYLPSSATGSLAITRAHTRLVLAAVAPILQGSSAVLSGVLSSTDPNVLIPVGTKVVLGIGFQFCTATTTDTSGAVSCTIPKVLAPVGYVVTSGVFTGTSADGPALTMLLALVYAFPPHGIYVIGDQTASGHVTFSGSQWAWSNRLSGGSAPFGFQGYANTSMPECGATWTAGYGDRPSPWSGPLPEYMAVVVSSSVRRSGWTLTGDVQKVVIVRTDGDHDGDRDDVLATGGTVVATVCG